MRISVLGSLEVSVEGGLAQLGGPKQRAVLVTLVLNANQIVSVARLLDAVWGERPPPTARHTLEVYVSRLRGVLAPGRPSVQLLARAPGYVLAVDEDFVDSLGFLRLVDAARASADDPSMAALLFREGLSLWRGRAAQDVELGIEMRAEAERLDELRLSVLEEAIQLELESGHDAQLIPELEALVAQHPFRDGFRSSLMRALYRSGRRAEALDVYHAGRRVLSDELGLEPSLELRALASEIIRQEPPPSPHGQRDELAARSLDTGRRRLAWIAVAAAAAIALLAIGLAVTRWAESRDGAPPLRVAVVIPGGIDDESGYPLGRTAWRGLQLALEPQDVHLELLGAEGQPDEWERTLESAARAATNDLVIAALSAMGPVLQRVASRHPEQQFAFVDGSVAEVGGLPNVAGIVFAENEAGFLAGYLAGLLEVSRFARLNPPLTVSAVAALPVPAITRYLAGFRAGVQHASRAIDVDEGFTNSFVGQHLCGNMANRQIDSGSDIVFAVAGPCGLGAIAAVGIRGVWAIGADDDLSGLGSHVLASATKRLDRAMLIAVEGFVEGRLAPGSDVVLGLTSNAVGLTGINPMVPSAIRRKVAAVDEAIRANELTVPTG